jgi:acyl-coenzyme A synthetase/AMP-(fatty) acid ligase
VTAEYIAYHAAERPDAVAIVNNGRSITYPEFARQIRQFARALRALGLPRGSTAAIDCAEPYFKWVLRLAFEQLRVVSATVELPNSPNALSLMRGFEVVLSGKSFPAGAVRHYQTTPAWFETVLASGEEDQEPTPEKRPDDPIRIELTSGTTGMPKRILHTRHTHDVLIAKTLCFGGFTRESRYLAALPTVTTAPTACIRAGGTVVFERRMSVAEAITSHAITHSMMSPFVLQRVLDDLPTGFTKPVDLTILSLGAAVSRVLREQALSRLATAVYDMYGSNEVGLVSTIRTTGEIGAIWPGARVEIVDDQDRPLPLGDAGHIRVQTDCMIHGYIDDPDAIGRIFRDGWFYPGDVGILRDSRRLQVIGRADDVLNLGWRKFAPELIEEMILRSIEAADVGVCSIPNANGIGELCIAVVSPRASDAELLRHITEAFRGYQFGKFHVVKLPSIPRTPNGKRRRNVLKEAVAEAIRQNAAR